MKRIAFLAAAILALTFASNKSPAFFTGGVMTNKAPVVGCTINSVSLSNTTFAAGVSNTPVGTVSSSTSGSCPSNSFSISGTDAAKFQLSGTTLETNGSQSAGSYNINIVNTIVGAVGSPFTQPKTLTGGTGVALTNMVAVGSGSTQTNVPFSIGVPFNAGVIDSSHHLVATDGISGNPITCDENNRYSDLTPNVRGATLSCIIPSLTASTTDTIALTVASGAPGSGTDLTTANIVSAAGSGPSDLNSRVVLVDKASGNTYIASPLDALNSGHTAWVNTSTAAILGKWRGGGGVVTGYILYAPLMHSGTPHPRLFVKYDVECYKAAAGAYNSSTNPILTCQTDVSIQSGVAQNASPADDEYSLTIGSTGTPTTTANFPTTSPSYNLTLGANNANSFTSGTASTGTPFTINTIGGCVDDGTGYGIIAGNPAPTSTVINVGVVKPFAGTTLTGGGGYKIYGMCHPYGMRYTIRANWSPSGTPSNLSVENGNLYLGNAWNNGTLTGGPAPYVIASKAILNYQTAASAITNPNFASGPNNPTAFNGGNIVGGGQSGNGTIGSWNMYQEATGNYIGVSPTPDTYVGALIRYDSNAAGAIFKNAATFMTLPDHVIDSGTGLTPSMSSGTDWAFNAAFTGVTAINLGISATSLSSWGAYPQTAHQPDNFHLPYVLSGDWKWLDADVDLTMTEWATVNPLYGGSQLNRVFLTPNASVQIGQTRGDYHFWRNLGHLALILPDTDTNSTPSTVVGWTKDDTKSYLEHQYTAINSGSYGALPAPGSIIQVSSNGTGDPLCSGHTCNPNFLTPGPRWLELYLDGPAFQWAAYQQSYGQVDAASLAATGMLSANGMKFWGWSAVGVISTITDSAELTPIPAIAFYWWEGDSVTPVYDWATQYKIMSLDGPGTLSGFEDVATGYGVQRVPAGTAALSATSGSSITVTIPTGYLGAGLWYTSNPSVGGGGWFTTPDGGACQILASPAPTATTFHCSTSVTNGHAFGSMSYTNTTWVGWQWSIPLAAPGDPVGLEVAGIKAQWIALGSAGGIMQGPDYIQIAQAAVTLACAYITPTPTGCPGAATTILGYSGGSMALYDPITWNIAP
jgi:hypothetical protein